MQKLLKTLGTEKQSALQQPVAPGSHVAAYDVLRVIVTLMVVLGHATYLTFVTPYGQLDYMPYVSAMPLVYRGCMLISGVIYTFHMPLFMALSGALFCRTLRRGKYTRLGPLLRDKAQRLLIPFFVTGGVIRLPAEMYFRLLRRE